MPMPDSQPIALQSLQSVSRLAAHVWQHLQDAQSPESEVEGLEWLWQLQLDQEKLIDAHAELADQIDEEIATIQTRIDRLLVIRQFELDRLHRWRQGLDAMILRLNHEGVVGTEIVGQTRRIRIKLNPPACQVLNFTEVPQEYMTVKLVEDRRVDKTAVKAAWSQGIPVPGTEVTRKQKVVYELAPTSLERMKSE